MSALGQYILSVLVTAVLTTLVRSTFSDGFSGELLKLISGVVLTIVIIAPVKSIDLSSNMMAEFIDTNAAHSYCETGSAMAEMAISDIIKQETEAYILSKANEWNAQIQVDVSMCGRVPVQIQIDGDVSPAMEKRITSLLELDLRIPRENHVWI